MLCRTLRNVSTGRWALAGLLCLTLAWGTAVPTRLSFQDDGDTSIGIRTPEFPLAALATTSSVRFEKHGQAVRLTFHKPERSSHLSSAERSCGVLFRPRGCSAFSTLPRRFLQPRHLAPRTPNEAADPFLALPSLS